MTGTACSLAGSGGLRDGLSRCGEAYDCSLSGELTFTRTVYGTVYLLENDDSKEDYCVAFAAEEPLMRRHRSVVLYGKMIDRIESNDCIYVTYGVSNIPCGYCPGSKLFLADDLEFSS